MAYIPQCSSGGQRTTCGSQFSPVMWVPGDQLELSSLVTGTSTSKSVSSRIQTHVFIFWYLIMSPLTSSYPLRVFPFPLWWGRAHSVLSPGMLTDPVLSLRQVTPAAVNWWLRWPCHIQKASFHFAHLPALTSSLFLLLGCPLSLRSVYGGAWHDVLFSAHHSELKCSQCWLVLSVSISCYPLHRKASLAKAESSTDLFPSPCLSPSLHSHRCHHMVSLCSSGWSGTYNVDQAGFKVTFACFCLQSVITPSWAVISLGTLTFIIKDIQYW